MDELSVQTWGEGTPVVLVHGSLATGAEEWQAQQPLTDHGYQLVVPDRRGYGASPAADGEDFVADGADVAELAGDGAHLVGHSYGGLGALVAAARRPEATRSLALLEPPVFALAEHRPDARVLSEQLRSVWESDLDDRDWALRFLRAVGTDPDQLPEEVFDQLAPLVPVMRRGRPVWETPLPLGSISSAGFPVTVISGGHHRGFEDACDELADRIGADRVVVEGAGHEIQFTGDAVNEVLLELWRRAG